jgi:hypothetical protein
MTSQNRRIMKRVMVGFLAGGIVATVLLWVAAALECEFPFWPSLWLAERTRTSDGTLVTELVRARSGSNYVSQYWHHCTWCDVVYPHAPHSAVKVTVNTNEYDFYLFDWDLRHRKLLPSSVRTAKAFPELVPTGYVVEPLGVGLNPQLYRDDEPCSIIAKK